MTETVSRSVTHDSFSIERTYPAAPASVFAAWADQAAKSQWFGDDEIESKGTHTLDFRVGGREHLDGVAGGMHFEYDATFQDIVTDQRIVWSYDMHINGARISVSVGTVEITPVPGGTKLVMTEQGAFLDGLDTNAQRAAGTTALLDELGTFLAAGA
jgi:uncharacterized protein YndB with AHSA1/START domain